MKVVLLYSGGLDSTTLLYDLRAQGHQVQALSVNYFQSHVRELRAAEEICRRINVPFTKIDAPVFFGRRALLDGSGAFEGENTVVPGRNLVFLSLAMSLCIGRDGDAVAIGATKTDSAIYPDCRRDFLEAFGDLARLTYYPRFTLLTPYLELTKREVAEFAVDFGVPIDLTWSCYRGGETPCGNCGACHERASAIAGVGYRR